MCDFNNKLNLKLKTIFQFHLSNVNSDLSWSAIESYPYTFIVAINELSSYSIEVSFMTLTSALRITYYFYFRAYDSLCLFPSSTYFDVILYISEFDSFYIQNVYRIILNLRVMLRLHSDHIFSIRKGIHWHLMLLYSLMSLDFPI